ncbi:MAG: hypothetical protein P4M11_12360 [Candidatus Pacebacteria bacterium]|nr:hypothetical protein [Candidatus Paceibacterota bacterium]
MVLAYYLKLLRQMSIGEASGSSKAMLSDTGFNEMHLLQREFVSPFMRKIVETLVDMERSSSRKMLVVRLVLLIVFILVIVFCFLFLWRPFINGVNSSVTGNEMKGRLSGRS